MGFLRRVAGVSLRDEVRSLVIREELGLEPLLFCVERSQLRLYLVWMPPGRLPLEVFQARPASGGRWRWRDYISALAWKCIRILQSEPINVAREKEVWNPPAEMAASSTRPRISG